ncbi:MAG: hypothetical protein QOG99_2764 [Frankiales bacterium]|nr:hypothetical protein [Frankiales bacterium]
MSAVTSHTTSVVIRCLNEEAHIGRLLTGLMRQRTRPGQIVVVDSGSTDGTLDIARRFPVEVVHIAPEEFSFGRALNRGLAVATGEVGLLLSAHVYPVRTTWLEEMVAPFARPDVALSYGRQQGNEVTRYSEHRILDRWFPRESDPDQRHPFCNNANAAVRLDVWKRQPYDEDLTGLEDMAWAKAALDQGYRVAYVAEAAIVHAHDESWASVVNRYRREAIAHKRIYDEAKMSAPEAASLFLASVGSDLTHAVRDRSPSKVSDIVSFRAAQFLGTYQGFAQSGPVHAALKRRFYYPGVSRQVAVSDRREDDLIDYGDTSGPAESSA